MPSVVKINVLTVPDDQREVLEKRFASRAGSVENSDGFEWFELLRPRRARTSTSSTPAGAARRTSRTGWPPRCGVRAAAAAPAEGGERPKPAASGSKLWSFEVVQQAAPKA